MPCKTRIDAPGALHHGVAGGIERRKVFADDTDRNNFLDRGGGIISETNSGRYARAPIPSYFKILLRTGRVLVATVMRRLLTGHTEYFNKRHRRSAHLFQNRYKSILCQEDTYLLELVRHIHLNPLRAKIVQDLNQFKKNPHCAHVHSALMGKYKRDWQDTKWVLRLFDKRLSGARQRYHASRLRVCFKAKRKMDAIFKLLGSHPKIFDLQRPRLFSRPVSPNIGITLIDFNDPNRFINTLFFPDSSGLFCTITNKIMYCAVRELIV